VQFENKVKSLYVFGSVLTSSFDDNIYMLVNINSTNLLEYADCYFNLKFASQDLLNFTHLLFPNQHQKVLSLFSVQI